MKLVSWNVNGLRSCLTKGFLEYVKNEDPDILCLQETKLQPEQAQFALVRAAFLAGWLAAGGDRPQQARLFEVLRPEKDE